MFYVYVLENPNTNSWYIGFSSNLRRRVQEHHADKKRGWRLVYYEAYLYKMDAIGREQFLKGGSGRKYLYKQLKNHLACRDTEVDKRSGL